MIHLKIRTEYSFGKTFAPIDRVINRLKEIGCTAAGIVDGSTWGHVRWFDACHQAGIQPLLGVSRVVSDGSNPTTMWFLAKNKEGLTELYQLCSQSYYQKIKGRFGSRPRLYRADVEGMSDNIIKFAGDIVDGEWLKSIGAYADLNPASRILNIKKSSLGLPLVHVSDNAYAYPEDKRIFDVASKAGSKVSPEHIQDTLECGSEEEIAKSCEGLELPKANIIKVEGDLDAVCRKGAEKRGISLYDKRYNERYNREIKTIREKDFESYFLVVADMVEYAKKHMLVGPSRGSAAGSLVCYLAGITEIDPIAHGLIFERFIDVSRSDLPDIDLDFPDNKREMVFDHMRIKYGAKNTAHIGTISQFRARSALVQVCKALDIPPQASGGIKSEMLDSLAQTFEKTEAGRKFLEGYPHARVAEDIEGHASHSGVHAAGLLVSNTQITNICTVDDNGIAHVEKRTAEALGLLKIDVLGLRTLTILEDAKCDIKWYELPLDDEKALDVYRDQKFCGIFQFEGQAMKSIARDIEFKSISQIDAVTALARPGPMQSGVHEKYLQRAKNNNYKGIHPKVDELLKDTYGLPVYQEQTLAIVREIGGFDWSEASAVRKAISKTGGKAVFDKMWAKFHKNATKYGLKDTQSREIWATIETMGAWQMNKAHTRSYAVVSYWTAYLKAHFPLQFTCSALNHIKDEDSAIKLLREFVNSGGKYIAFDINRSKAKWSIDGDELVGGFECLEGIGEIKAQRLEKANHLDEHQLKMLQSCKNPYENLEPIKSLYQSFYDDPDAHGLGSPVSHISDIVESPPKHKEQRLFIGELVKKELRCQNDEINLKKRGGKRKDGPTEYVALKFKDDSGEFYARVGRFEYQRIGKKLLEEVPVGTHLLCRGTFYNNIAFAFITKWRSLGVGEE